MCKTLTGVRKTNIKIINHKKRKSLHDQLQLALYNGQIEVNNISNNDATTSQMAYRDCSSNVVKLKREKSRIAAKTRRNMEKENLTKLYLALPVTPQSRLLSCDDSDFIGFFEKTTIIKVSAYILKLYNALAASNQLAVLGAGHNSAISLFSETVIGLFWCEKSEKVVFTTPGLARLTGLYWCNIIGMPMNSIIIDSAQRQDFNSSSNLMFLRFMVNALKDRGIFTVQPSSKLKSNEAESSEDKKPFTSNQMIGKMPCSVWSSEKLSNGLRFDIIQPLITRSRTMQKNLLYIMSSGESIKNLPINRDDSRPLTITGKPFSIYFEIGNYGTLAVDAEILPALGFTKKELLDSNIFNFFYLPDVVKLNNHLKEIMADKSKIKRDIGRICTGKLGVYRICRYTIQINGDQELTIPSMLNSRTLASQGEAYSQNVVDALCNMDMGLQSNSSPNFATQNSYVQARVIPISYFYEDGSELSEFSSESVHEHNVPNAESDFTEYKGQCSSMCSDWLGDHPCTPVSFDPTTSQEKFPLDNFCYLQQLDPLSFLYDTDSDLSNDMPRPVSSHKRDFERTFDMSNEAQSMATRSYDIPRSNQSSKYQVQTNITDYKTPNNIPLTKQATPLYRSGYGRSDDMQMQFYNTEFGGSLDVQSPSISMNDMCYEIPSNLSDETMSLLNSDLETVHHIQLPVESIPRNNEAYRRVCHAQPPGQSMSHYNGYYERPRDMHQPGQPLFQFNTGHERRRRASSPLEPRSSILLQELLKP